MSTYYLHFLRISTMPKTKNHRFLDKQCTTQYFTKCLKAYPQKKAKYSRGFPITPATISHTSTKNSATFTQEAIDDMLHPSIRGVKITNLSHSAESTRSNVVSARPVPRQSRPKKRVPKSP